MTQKILVTFNSRTGATAGVAQAIGAVFSEKGAQVDVYPIQDVKDFSEYQAVITGSAIQNQQWLPEAMQFLQANRAALSAKPFATFSVCMTLAMRNGEKYRPQISDWLAPVRKIVPPISEGIFAGVLDIRKIPSFGDRLKFRMSVLFGVWSEGDHRDWNAIREWANELYPRLSEQ